MKNLIKIVAASATALLIIFYINYNGNNSNLFIKRDLAVNNQENKILKIKSTAIPAEPQSFKSKVVIDEKEGFVTPCFHHSQN